MDTIDKIRAEIKKRLNWKRTIQTSYYMGCTDELNELLSFLNTLSEEPVSDCHDLEEAAWDCVLDSVDVNNPVLLPKYKELLTYLFIAGAEWQKAKMMEWLEGKVNLSYGVATDAFVEVIDKLKSL